MPSASKGFLVASALLVFAEGSASTQSAPEGERLFQEKCTACHRIGGGKLVGPDLLGVTSRRDTAWLRRQIKDPLGLIAESDPIATQLVEEANGMLMVPLGLTDDQVESVIAFLERSSQQAEAARGIPRQYLPTVSISAAVALALTAFALNLGRKRVDVRPRTRA